MTKANQIIVALDYDDSEKAWALVEQLGDSADFYKVGLQLLTSAGPSFVRKLVDAKKRVFLDLKTFEIPNSVAGAVDSAGALGASMVTVHASGGSKALDAAVKASRAYPELTVLGLTVVTSMTDSDLQEVGITSSIDEQVLRLAKLAVNAGCGGLVASTHETRMLRQQVPGNTVIVTPGIQIESTDSNDQQRVASPRHAIESGASFLVIGRSITKAADPLAVFSKATLEIS
jgi:orotidine-5'-phosphate decarboxylase